MVVICHALSFPSQRRQGFFPPLFGDPFTRPDHGTGTNPGFKSWESPEKAKIEILALGLPSGKLPEGMGPDREVVRALAGRFFDDTYPYTSHIL